MHASHPHLLHHPAHLQAKSKLDAALAADKQKLDSVKAFAEQAKEDNLAKLDEVCVCVCVGGGAHAAAAQAGWQQWLSKLTCCSLHSCPHRPHARRLLAALQVHDKIWSSTEQKDDRKGGKSVSKAEQKGEGEPENVQLP